MAPSEVSPNTLRFTIRRCAAIAALLILPLLVGAHKPKFTTATINNLAPRTDSNGNIVDAHDGCLHFYNGSYYLYGTAYGDTAGYSINNRFRVYSSPDLTHWTFEGELLESPPDGVYYRPYVAYNAVTHKYVLWYNWYPKLWDGKIGVATSDTPTGPFTLVNPAVQLSQAKDAPGDGGLFVDKDNIAYFIYTVINQHHAIRIERLTPDFLGSAGVTSDVLGIGCEAPAMFRRGPYYFALFDSACCFCAKGSGARVLRSTSPLGPYTQKANINRDDSGRPINAAQETFVAELPTPNGTAYMWMADRWRSSPDGIKGHDLQYWSPPLQFNTDGSIQRLTPTPTWSLAIQEGSKPKPPVHPYLWPTKTDPNPQAYDVCNHELIRKW